MYISLLFLHLGAPYNVTATGNNMYPQGDQLVLNCLSEGGPELKYSWIFEGNEINSTPTLTINDVTATNGGDYTCNVTNYNDTGYSSDIITVYSKICIIECISTHTHSMCMISDAV